MNIAHFLRERALIDPNGVAIIDRPGGRERQLTFHALDHASARGAALLKKHGLRKGDRVLLLHPMSAELYIALASLFRLGLVAMFLDPSAGRELIAACCEIGRPRAFLGSRKAQLQRLVNSALREIPLPISIGGWVPGAVRWRSAERFAPLSDIESVPADAPALLTFTIGSTGLPKATVRSHASLLRQHEALQETIGLIPGDVDLATMPIVLLANLVSGVTSLIPPGDLRNPGRIDPKLIVRQVEAHEACSTVASPAFLAQFARQGVSLPSLRKVFSGGAPVFPCLLSDLAEVAPAARLVAVYGSTEAEPIAQLDTEEIGPEDHERMRSGGGLLVGRPVASITVRVMRDQWGIPVSPMKVEEFDQLCLRSDQPGEIVVTGPHVLKGYLDGYGDEETKFKVDGVVWHRTGDAGYFDEQGRLWLLGRCGARISDQRGTIYPFAVECAVSYDRRIRRAALAAYRGKRVLVIEPGRRATDREALKGQLGWAGLDAVLAVPAIPVDRRHNAKVDYPALRRLLKRAMRNQAPR